MHPSLQPPSGGCVLKLDTVNDCVFAQTPAAFRRLCVETALDCQPAVAVEPSRLQAAVC